MDHITSFCNSLSLVPISLLAFLIFTLPSVSRAYILYLEFRRCHCFPVKLRDAAIYGLLDTIASAAELFTMRMIHIYGTKMIGTLIFTHFMGQFAYWYIATEDFRQCPRQHNIRMSEVETLFGHRSDAIGVDVILPCKRRFGFIFGLKKYDENDPGRVEYLEGLKGASDKLRVVVDKHYNPTSLKKS